MFTDKIAVLVLSCIIVIFIVYNVLKVKSGKIPEIRKIAGLEAIEEAIGRSIEQNRPVHFTPGSSSKLSNQYASQTLASNSILRYVARLTASLGAKLIVSVGSAEIYNLFSEIVEESYLMENMVVPSDTLRYYSEGYAFQQGAMNTVLHEKPGSQIFIGAISMDGLLLTEAASRVGTVTISGTARTFWIPFLTVTSDYVLIGEEIFVAGTYLSKDPIESGSIVGQDWGKFLTLFLLVLGSILSVMGNTFLWRLLQR